MSNLTVDNTLDCIKEEADLAGRIRWGDNLQPVKGAEIEILPVGVNISENERGSERIFSKLSEDGKFVLETEDVKKASKNNRYKLIVRSEDGHILYQSDTINKNLRQAHSFDILIPGNLRRDRRIDVPTVRVGALDLNAEELSKTEPEDVLRIARALVDPKVAEKEKEKISRLSERLVPAHGSKEWVCSTPILQTIDAIIKRKEWPRKIALEVEDILHMRWTDFAEQTHECDNFKITYQDSGPAAVPSSTASEDVVDPGSDPPQVLATLPSGGAPTYIKRLCFWLERALAAYTDPPFSMKNPAASGKIPVVVNSDPYGGASPSGTFYINNDLDPDLVCAVSVHELFHLVQYEYGGSGTWKGSVFEGGAVFAENTAADLMNRYIDETRTNFNGTGVMANPNLSLDTAEYKTSLFWRYVAEQHSADRTEPFVGVETYRKIIKECSSGSYANSDVRSALRQLPWYQDFYQFHYLDPGNKDLTNGETTFGNYVLACYLKDQGINNPDTRFDFIEDEENIHIDNVIGGTPADITSMPSVTVTSVMNLTPSGSTSSISQTGNVNNLASRYYELNIDPSVTNVQVQFSANSGFDSHLFQIVQIDEDGNIRDIHRTDKDNYTKCITNDRDGKKLDRLMVVVSGCDDSGSFNINFDAVGPVSDVMVTRWNSAKKKEYEIDSRNWTWTWVSPDIWVDNDGDGAADSEVYFNYNNKLHIRLHNKGNADANNIQVEFHYQNAAGGLSDSAWLPVRNKSGDIQTLNSLSLSAGTSDDWSVDWSPQPDGSSEHFCIRAVVTVPGDPNTDNKRVLSNFGNVISGSPYFDLRLIRRNILDLTKPVDMKIIPRLPNNYHISRYDMKRLEVSEMEPGEMQTDDIRIYKAQEDNEIDRHLDKNPIRLRYKGLLRPRLRIKPDLQGDYKTPEEALPPGVAGRPMVTVVHEIEGIPLGGVTFLLSEEEEK